MAWLRVDDGFAQHPKISRLPRGDRWTWLEVLLYCARYRTSGHVPASVTEVLPKVTPAFLNRCFELHLLDLDGGTEDYMVHDWASYNPKDPTAADRMRAYRERNEAVTPPVTNTVTPDEHKRNATVSRAQPRARVPSPTPEETYGSSSSFPSKPRTDSKVAQGTNPDHRYRKSDNTAAYTGCRQTHGSHGQGWTYDPLGIDPPPPDWPHPKPTRAQILTALNQQALEPKA